MSKHKMTATIPHGDPDIGAEIECDIVFSFTPGSSDYWNRHVGTWEQGYPAEVELVSVTANLLDMGAFHDLQQKHLEDIVSDWLQGRGYDEALAVVASDSDAAADYAADLRADR